MITMAVYPFTLAPSWVLYSAHGRLVFVFGYAAQGGIGAGYASKLAPLSRRACHVLKDRVTEI